MVYINNRRFEWDASKAEANLNKHGISFEEAAFSFDDPYGFAINDRKHSYDEMRFLFLGSNGKKVLVTAYTIRKTDIFRIISARLAGRKERRKYEEKIKTG